MHPSWTQFHVRYVHPKKIRADFRSCSTHTRCPSLYTEQNVEQFVCLFILASWEGSRARAHECRFAHICLVNFQVAFCCCTFWLMWDVQMFTCVATVSPNRVNLYFCSGFQRLSMNRVRRNTSWSLTEMCVGWLTREWFVKWKRNEIWKTHMFSSSCHQSFIESVAVVQWCIRILYLVRWICPTSFRLFATHSSKSEMWISSTCFEACIRSRARILN